MSGYDDEMEDDEGGVEPAPSSLAHWLEEQYTGDDRFDTVEVLEPGPLEGEAIRIKFVFDDHSHFFVAVLEDDGQLRIGLATDNRWVSEAIETAALETGDSLTEFLEDEMEANAELEHEVQHFHDDVFYFCSDIPFQRPEDLASPIVRDEIVSYLDGYMTALISYLETDEE